MNVINLLNLKVNHKIFGIGMVTEVSDNYVTVSFDTKKSKFVFPNSFEKFLAAEDNSIQTAILNEINCIKMAADIQRSKIKKERCVEKEQVIHTTRKRKNIEEGFHSDYNVKYLAKQHILNYKQVEKQFGIKIAGFGRGINRTASSIVLISSINKKKNGFVYHDHWTNEGDYIFSGEGKTGNQQMKLGNKAIVNAELNKKTIHLFVKFSPQEYYYQGIFSLIGYTYEDDKDNLGNVRKEYKFKLRKKV